MNNLSAYLQNAGFAFETLDPTQNTETLGVKPDRWPAVAAFLKTDATLDFDFLSYMVGLDEGEAVFRLLTSRICFFTPTPRR